MDDTVIVVTTYGTRVDLYHVVFMIVSSFKSVEGPYGMFLK